MEPTWKSANGDLQLFYGDSFRGADAILPQIPDNTFSSIVTDPPYELDFMGIILDPFGGSFSTAIAAWKENCACWSIESHRPYFDIGLARVKNETGKYPLFADE